MPQGIIRQSEQYNLDVPEPVHHGMTEAQVADMLRPPRIHRGTMDRRDVSRETTAALSEEDQRWKDWKGVPPENVLHQHHQMEHEDSTLGERLRQERSGPGY
jgi:hypothetical protein